MGPLTFCQLEPRCRVLGSCIYQMSLGLLLTAAPMWPNVSVFTAHTHVRRCSQVDTISTHKHRPEEYNSKSLFMKDFSLKSRIYFHQLCRVVHSWDMSESVSRACGDFFFFFKRALVLILEEIKGKGISLNLAFWSVKWEGMYLFEKMF